MTKKPKNKVVIRPERNPIFYFTVFRPGGDEPGKICSAGYAPSEKSALAQPVQDGEQLLIGQFGNYKRHYVKGDKVVERKPLPVTINKTIIADDGEDIVTIEFPPDLKNDRRVVTVNDVVQKHDGSNLELASLIPGRYFVCIHQWPYIDFRTVIEVEAR